MKFFKVITKIYEKIPFINKLYNLSVKQKYYMILTAIAGLYVYLYIAGPPDPDNTFSICIFKNVTGYACPSCGTTRGLKLLVHGCFKEALLMNPLSYLTIFATIITAIWITVDLVKNQNFGKMVALQGNKIVSVELEEAISKSKTVDMELYEIAKIFFG